MDGGSPPKNSNSAASLPLHEPAVKETHRISIDYNPVSGRKKLNTYEIIKELGRGEHGRVKLGYDVDKDIYVAIKLINRKEKPRLGRPQGSSTEEKIHREIAILKKCCHPNIVKLIEVLDDESSRKIYLVLEYCAKGEIKWQTPDGHPSLMREQARSVGRNIASGLEYLHANGIIHRDIKPANLLVGDNNVVKISDFGVSYAMSAEANANSELELAKTVGTPAFFSPELCVPTEFDDSGERRTPHIGSKVDVWAFGVTLYCFLYGCLPFEADNEYELFRVIANDDLVFSNTAGDEDLELANDLLRKLLVKDPALRPTMSEVKHHPWLLKNLSPSRKKEFLNHVDKEAISVSLEEVDEAVKGVNIKSKIRQGLSRIAEQIRPRSRSRSQSRSSGSQCGETVSAASSTGTSATSKPASGHSNHDKSSKPCSQARRGSGSSQSSRSQIREHKLAPEYSIGRSSLASLTDVESIGSSASNDRNYASQSCPSQSGPPQQDQSSRSVMHSNGNICSGLMPMNLSDDNSITSSLPQDVSIENLSLNDPKLGPTQRVCGASNVHPQLPELEIPRLDNDSLWDISSSSSSEDDDSGELTLVVGRNRSRSVERGRNVPPAPEVAPNTPERL